MKRYTFSLPAYAVVEVDAHTEESARALLDDASAAITNTHGGVIVVEQRRGAPGIPGYRIAGAYLDNADDPPALVEEEVLP